MTRITIGATRIEIDATGLHVAGPDGGYSVELDGATVQAFRLDAEGRQYHMNHATALRMLRIAGMVAEAVGWLAKAATPTGGE